MNWETWGPPIVVLGVGISIGLGIAVRGVTAGRRASRREDLDARREVLVEAVRELDADREKLTQDEWQSRRDALIGQMASVLEQMDAPETAQPAEPTAPAATSRRALWISVTLSFFVLLAGLLVHNATPRGQGDTMTGGQGSSGPPPEIAAALAAIEKNPDDLDALNTLTWGAIRMRSLDGAMEYLKRAQTIAPQDPFVLTHMGVLQMQVNMFDRASASLEAALDAHPGLPRAVIWHSALRHQMGDTAGALTELNAMLAGTEATGEERLMAASLLTELNKPPVQDRVAGSVRLTDGVKIPEGGVLFVIARRTEAGGGPPVAAFRAGAAQPPLDFVITDENMMLGGEWPEQVWVTARYDADGNPTTRGESDLESETVGPLASGATGLDLVLK